MTDGGFDVALERSLKREGLSGRIWARVEGPTLHLQGSDGGALAIPAGLVERLRFGQVPTRSSGLAWRALIWRKGLGKPLFLTSLDRNYGPAMREFAGHVAAGGPARVERGPSPLQLYVAMPAILLACAGMAAGAAYEALRGGTPWYWAFAVAMALITLKGALMVRADWPRPLGDLAELDAILPRG